MKMEITYEQIKTAAESLYNKGEITAEELEKVAFNPLKAAKKVGQYIGSKAKKAGQYIGSKAQQGIDSTLDAYYNDYYSYGGRDIVEMVSDSAKAVDNTNKAIQGTMDTIQKIKTEGPNLFKSKSRAQKLAETAADKLRTYALPAFLAGSGVAIAKETLVDPVAEQAQIGLSYKKMFDKHPNLAGEDQRKVKDYFNVVKTYSPQAAKNPVVAGSMVNRMIEFNGVDHNLVSALGNIKRPESNAIVTIKNLGDASKNLPKMDMI